ncbi:ankyrin repeat protein [Dictyocaulus viviparus]|uniref:Ankyrin repeat protein n=1 Tax=Dictyocaulus viviparus TaxID=29172 RepID=A0A0D8XHM9_DICVI|nr:ankyrin repeat protein [Dictyocaulus viviparus]
MSQPTPSRLYIESASAHPISFPFTAKEANQRGPYGRTPLMMLAKNTVKTEEQLINDVTKLCDIGADINLLDDCEWIIQEFCGHLSRTFFKVNAVDNSNRTALMLVAMHDRVDTKAAKMLIEAGAKVDYDGDNTLTSWRGRTALHFAAKYDNAQMVAFLLQMMANENCQDYEYCTPLHLAAAEGHIGPVKELLKGGANVLLRNDRYQTPYDIALLNNCHSVAALLASSDNLRVQLYSNHGEMLASSSPPCFKHVKILSSNIKPPRAHVTYESKGCTQSTTAADESASVFSPYNYIITPYSAAVCGTTTPSELSSVKSAQMVSSGCTTHSVHYITPYVQRFDDSRIDPGSILSSPHYEEVEKCCMKSEKQMGKSSGFFDSGFGISSDISSKRDSIAPCHTFDRFLIPKDCVDACSKPFVSSQEFIV